MAKTIEKVGNIKIEDNNTIKEANSFQEWEILPDSWPQPVKDIIVTIRKVLRKTIYKSRMLEELKKVIVQEYKEELKQDDGFKKILSKKVSQLNSSGIRKYISERLNQDDDLRRHIIKYEHDNNIQGIYEIEDAQKTKTELLDCMGHYEELLAINYNYFNATRTDITYNIKKAYGGIKWIYNRIDPLDNSFKIKSLGGLKWVVNSIISTTRALTPLFEAKEGVGIYKLNTLMHKVSDLDLEDKTKIVIENFDVNSFLRNVEIGSIKMMLSKASEYIGELMEPDHVEKFYNYLTPENRKVFFIKLFAYLDNKYIIEEILRERD